MPVGPGDNKLGVVNSPRDLSRADSPLRLGNMTTFVTHLESALDGTRFEAGRVHTVHQGRPLWVRYDLPAVRANARLSDLPARTTSLWRYRELLPVPFDAEPVSLGEGLTPILHCPRLGRELGLTRLLVKDE